MRPQVDQERPAGHLSGPLSSHAQRSRGRLAPPGRRGVQSGAARSPPRTREERGAPGSRARNCPAAAEIAPQMGRSCALTGLNWKRSEPVILKAGGNAGSLFARHVPPADPGRPSAAVRPATRTLAARLPAHRASPGAPGRRAAAGPRPSFPSRPLRLRFVLRSA